MVLSLTLAGFFSVEVATAQEKTEGASPPPRFRFGIEQTIGSFQHSSFPEGGGTAGGLSWGFGRLDFTADFRVSDRFELGFAAGASGSRTWIDSADSRFDSTSNDNSLRLSPRAGVAIPISQKLALVPRAGVEYTHTVSHSEGIGASTPAYVSGALSVTPGLMLDYAPTRGIFIGTGAEADYRIYTKMDYEDAGWFSDQPIEQFSLNWLVAAGGRI